MSRTDVHVTPARSPLAVCAQLTQAIGRTESLEEIYEAALDALSAGLGVERASVLLFEPDGVMRFKAWRGLSDSYRRAVEGHTPWLPHARCAEPIVVADVQQDAGLAAFLPTIRAENIAAMAFIPLEGVDGVLGKFMLYYGEPHHLSSEEVQLASVIAAQIAFAVERTQAHQASRTSQAGRKEAELARVEALEQSNRASQRLAAIVQSSDDAIISKDLNGVIMSWNPAAERMFGYSESEAVGQSITLILPLDRRTEEDQVLGHIRAGEPVEMETVRQHRSGSRIDISLKVSPVKNADGRIVGASKIARDITPRKRADAERAELQRRLSLLVEASASLLNSPETESVRSATMSLARQLLVADGYAVWVNDPGQPGWRAAASEGISDDFSNRVISSYRGGVAPRALSFSEPLAVTDVYAEPLLEEQQAAYRHEGIRSVLVCPMRLGSERVATLVFYYRSAHAFGDIDVQTGQALANLAAAALTTADLYEEQRAQRHAAESRQRHAAFLADATTILSRSLDYEHTLAVVARLAVPEIADWCVVDMLDEVGRLQRLAVAHFDPAKVEYARALQQRYPADPNSTAGVHEVLRTGKPVMMASISADRVAASARDDEHRRILAELGLTSYMCVPLLSTSGTIGALSFVFAESGRHYTERDLAFAQDVAARAALAIDNALAYRRAYDANRLKDEFLATLSHELRTPLNAILGYAQMLSMGVLQEERQSHAIAVLTRNAESLRQMIDDVLDVSRITSGKIRLNVMPVQLDEIVRNAVATMQPAADAKGVALQVVVDAEIAPVPGDQDRLQQVVWNLLSNAVKFTPRGGHVRLRVAPLDSRVQLVLSDDGQGIDPAFLPHIFERFRQADSRFAREHGGLGLGLAIAREIVELHGGTLTATSDGPGTGATFTVSLQPMSAPREIVSAAPGARPATAAAAAAGLPDHLKAVRILAVDDQEDALGLLRVILESAGADVTTAASARHALDFLQNGAYDALITDIGMPQMDGLELIRAVRQTLSSPANRIPAAALTAYARSEDRVAALASGFQTHIAKPVNPSELVLAVAAMLRRSALLP